MRKLPRSSQRNSLSSLVTDLMLTNAEEQVKKMGNWGDGNSSKAVLWIPPGQELRFKVINMLLYIDVGNVKCLTFHSSQHDSSRKKRDQLNQEVPEVHHYRDFSQLTYSKYLSQERIYYSFLTSRGCLLVLASYFFVFCSSVCWVFFWPLISC